jgi:hypothetical protein
MVMDRKDEEATRPASLYYPEIDLEGLHEVTDDDDEYKLMYDKNIRPEIDAYIYIKKLAHESYS